MASASKASWIIAASVGAVEAFKDQGGLCRWNYAFRSLQQKYSKSYDHNKGGAFAQATKMISSMSGTMINEGVQQSEESLRKVMYLSCWGPY